MATMIVMQQSLAVVGSDGSTYWFLPGRQFEYTDTSMILNECVDCDIIYKKKKTKHYKVTIGEVYYWVPDYACVVYNKVVEEEKQDKQQYWVDLFADTTFDHEKKAKEVFGLVIDNTYHTDYDKDAYDAAVNATNNQKNIYVGAPGEEIPTKKESS